MKITVISFISILIIFSNLHSQGIPYGQEFQVNTYSLGNQLAPSAETLSNGNFVVCWENEVSREDYDIYGQIFDCYCSKQGNEFQVNTYANGQQIAPAVAKLPDSDFVVCWKSSGQHGDGCCICGQIFDSSAAKKGDEFQIYASQSAAFVNFAITELLDGRFVVCWESSGRQGAYGQIYDAVGAKSGPEFQIHNGNWASHLSVSVLEDGRFIVCFTGCFDHPYYDIYGQLFEPSGLALGDVFRVNTTSVDDQDYPDIATFENGGFVVCWMADIYPGPRWSDIFCQIFDSSNQKSTDEIQVNTNTFGMQVFPSVTSFIDERFVVLWESWGQDDSSSGIYGQFIDRSGAKLSHEFKVNDFTSRFDGRPVTTRILNHQFVACWESYEQDGSGFGIFGKCLPFSHPLYEFSLIEPLIDSILKTTRPIFRWTQPGNIRECFPWEITFDLYLDTDLYFFQPQIIKNIEDTVFKVDSLAAGKTYFWKVLAKNLAGDSLWSKQQDWGFFIKQGATSVATAEQNLPTHFELFQNYPNPFNSSTINKYSLAENSNVALEIYDLNSRLVDEIILNNQGRGEHEFRWTPQSLTSGVYLIKIQTKNWQKTIKVILLK